MSRDLIKRIEAIVLRAEEHAGTLPAKEAVKLRPADWHAVCRVAREAAAALEAEASEGERLREALVALRGFMPPSGDDRVDEALRLADAALIPVPAREGE